LTRFIIILLAFIITRILTSRYYYSASVDWWTSIISLTSRDDDSTTINRWASIIGLTSRDDNSASIDWLPTIISLTSRNDNSTTINWRTFIISLTRYDYSASIDWWLPTIISLSSRYDYWFTAIDWRLSISLAWIIYRSLTSRYYYTWILDIILSRTFSISLNSCIIECLST